MNLIRKGILYLSRHSFFNLLPDKPYLKLIYRCKFGKKLDLNNPKSFNEKIQWIKLYDRKPIYNIMADKFAVRQYVKDIIGEEYLIPLINSWDNVEDIDFDKLPNQFVLKCNHNSGLGMCICTDKSKLNIQKVKTDLQKGLEENYYIHGREWCYKDIPRKIIAEEYLKDNDRKVPEDYKVYCFNTKPKYIVVFHNRFNDSETLSETVYDTDWNKIDISLDDHFAISDIVEPKPQCLNLMLDFAQKLSKDTIQSRVDFYIVDKKLKFGEITLYTACGFQPMIPEALDDELGKYLKLPIEKTED